jgi:hypothetical protein
MMQRAYLVRAGVIAVLCAAGAIAFLGSRTSPAADIPARPDLEPYTLPATQIISWGDGAGRLDTATGAIFSLGNDADVVNYDTRWILRVPPVGESHSGLLDIQQPVFNPEATVFLVDIIEGHTWLLHLRKRSADQEYPVGTWVKVDHAPSAAQAVRRY